MTLWLIAPSKPTHKPSSTVVGRKVLLGLAKGRDKINAERKAQGEFNRRIVAEYAVQDAAAGRPQWGRSGRISRKLKTLGVQLSEKQVRKYICPR
jgi:hypothetical protein